MIMIMIIMMMMANVPIPIIKCYSPHHTATNLLHRTSFQIGVLCVDIIFHIIFHNSIQYRIRIRIHGIHKALKRTHRFRYRDHFVMIVPYSACYQTVPHSFGRSQDHFTTLRSHRPMVFCLRSFRYSVRLVCVRCDSCYLNYSFLR